MIAQLEQFLDFDQSYLRAQYEQNRSYYQQSGQGIRPWSFGQSHLPSSHLQPARERH